MSSEPIVFQVDVKSLILTADELSALTQFLRSKRFMHREYKGNGKGFGGDEYDYKLVRCDEHSRIEIKPVNEAVWLYLNTFGKEEK
jgi:hypothetical protein